MENKTSLEVLLDQRVYFFPENMKRVARATKARKKIMGEIADDVISGIVCQLCGCLIDGTEPGYPRNCEECVK